MAKPISIPWTRSLASSLSPRGDALLLLLAVAAIFSLLTHELSRRSALAAAADFEGFDSDDLDESDSDADDLPSLHLKPPSPPSTTLTHSSPESHHGPPPPSSPPSPNPKPPSPSSLDFWDEDEFEGFPSDPPSDPAANSDAESKSLPPPSPAQTDPVTPAPRPPLSSYTVEIICVSFLIAFAINFFTGKRQNELIALSWAAKFAAKDTIFDKNFSLLGTGDGKEDSPLLLKEGQDVFRFYASGRRNCLCLLGTIELQSRHDLVARIQGVVFPKKDTITFEVLMNEDAMDHVVVAVARKKLAKAMQKETRDLQKYAGLMVAPPAGRRWVAEELAVVAESKEVAGDLINDLVLDQVFGDKAFEKFGKWFISMHFSDQYPASHKKVLMLKFALPDVKNMTDMTRLITLVPYYIDLIGRYKLSSQARSKTEVARSKAAQEAFKELQNVRQEALQKKKAEKKKLQEEAEAKLSAESLRKREEKERARQLKKSAPKVKMLRH